MYPTALWGFSQGFVPFDAEPEPTEYVLLFEPLRLSAERGYPELDVLAGTALSAVVVLTLTGVLRRD